jgi:predicted RNA-binding Zn-ribbon protein involved in translation (DUF1610 family)
MSQHIHFIRKAAGFPVYRIKNDIHRYLESHHNPDSDQHKGFGNKMCITGLRAENLSIAGNNKPVRRIYVLCSDSGTYSQVGWALSSEADNCMVCGTVFRGSTGVKHHCRACGNVVCDKCSLGRALVRPLEELGPVRVCTLCSYGQSPVDSIPNVRFGRPVIGEFEQEEDNKHHKEDGSGPTCKNISSINLSLLLILFSFILF